jgi:hypothetical protein
MIDVETAGNNLEIWRFDAIYFSANRLLTNIA